MTLLVFAGDGVGSRGAVADRKREVLIGEAPGAYVGLLGDKGEARVRAAYPGATWDRAPAVKAAYDPDNLLRLNQNILPGV